MKNEQGDYIDAPADRAERWARVLESWSSETLSTPKFSIRQLKAIIDELPDAMLDRAVVTFIVGIGEVREVGDASFETDGRTVTEPMLSLTLEPLYAIEEAAVNT